MPASSPSAAASIRILPVGVGEGLGAGRGADQVEEGLAQGHGDAAADDDDLGAEDVDQAAQAEPEEVGRAVDLLGGDVVARGDRLGEVAALEPAAFAGDLLGEDGRDALADRLGDPPGDRGPAGEGLHAALRGRSRTWGRPP